MGGRVLRGLWIWCVALLMTGWLANAQDAQTPLEFEPAELRRIAKLSPLPRAPLDSTNRFDGTPAAERLGHFLFWDKRFSSNGEVACVTCHDPALAFSDGKPVAHTLARGPRRTPSLWNVSHGSWFFHDGRADSLWAQALQPFENPLEMGGDRLALLHALASDEGLRGAYEQLCGELPALEDGERFPAHARPDPTHKTAPHHLAWQAMAAEDQVAVNRAFSNVGKMLAAYQGRLRKADSAFDRWAGSLDKGPQAVRAPYPLAAQRGLRIFLGKGRCRLCHNGPNFSDGEFHALGLGARGGGMPTDSGRYGGIPLLERDVFRASGPYSDNPQGLRAQQSQGLLRDPATWGEFKTPSLRNLPGRGPYMHAGHFESLSDVLNFYSTLEGSAPMHQHQEQVLTARDFDAGELADLEAFLGSLEGVVTPGPWTQEPLGSPSGQ